MSHKLLSNSDVDNEKEIQDLKRILPTATDADLKKRLEQAQSELHPLGMQVVPFDKARPKKRKCPGPMDTDAHVLDNSGLFNNLVKATHRLQQLQNDSKKKRKVDHQVWCICKIPAASYGGEPMIQCDECQMWYHCECIGEDIQELKNYNRWACKDCELGKSKTLDVSQLLGTSLLRKNTGRLTKLSHLLIKRRHGDDWVNKFRVPSSLDSRLAQIEDIKECEEMTEDEIIAEMCRTHELMVQNNNELRDHIIKIATEKQREEMDKEYEMRKRQLINTHALVIHEMEIKQRTIQTQLYASKARYEKLDENTAKKINKLQGDLKQAEVRLKETRKELRKEKKKFSKDRQMWEGKFKETSKKSQNELQLRLREKKSLKSELEEKTEELNSLVSERIRLRKRCADFEEDLKMKDEQLEAKSSKLQKQIAKNSALAKKFRSKSREFDELEKKSKIADELSLDKKEKIEVKLKALQKRNRELVLFKKQAQALKKEAARDERRYLSERKKLKEKIKELEKREQQRKNENSRMSLQIKELELQIGRQAQQRQSLPPNCSTGRAVRNCPMSSKSLRAKTKVMKLSAKNLERLALSQFGRGKFAPGTFDQWLNTKSSSSRLCVNEDTLEDFIYGVICEKAGYNKCHPSAIELPTATSTVTKKVNGSATTGVAPPSHKKRTPWTLSMETFSCNKSSESTTLVFPKDRKPSISSSETLTTKVKVPAPPVVAQSSTFVLTTSVVATQSTVLGTPRISFRETSTQKPSPVKVKKIKPSPGEVTVVVLNKKHTTTGVTYCLRDIIFRKPCLRHPVEPVETLKRSFTAPGKVSGAKIDAGKSSPRLKHSKNIAQKKTKNKRSLDDTAKLSQVSPIAKKKRLTSTLSPTINGRRSKRQGKSSTTSSLSSTKSSLKDGNFSSEKVENVSTKKDEKVTIKKDEEVTIKKDEEVTIKKDETLSAKNDENISAAKDENISPKEVVSIKKVEDVSSTKGGNMPSKNERNVYSKKEVNANSKKEGNVASTQNENVSSKNVENFSKNDGDISSKKAVNVSYKMNGNVSSKKRGNFAVRKSGNVSSKKVRSYSTSKKMKFSTPHRMTWQKTGVCGLCHFRNIPKVIDPEGRMLVCGGDMCPRPWWHRACLRPIPSKSFLKLNKRWYCPHCKKDYQRVHMRKKSNPKERLAENLEPLVRDVERWLKENPSYERDDRLR